VFVERAKALVEVISAAAANSTSIDLQHLFMRYTLDSIGEVGYGVNINSIHGNPKANQFAYSFDYIQYHSYLRVLIHPLWKLFPQSKFQKHLLNVNQYVKDIITDRRKEIEQGVDLSRRDLLSCFLSVKNTDATSTFSDEYLLDVLKNFLIAGRDTTAVCLSWTFYLLSQHPEVEKKVLEEIRDVVGDDITYEKINKLKYTKQVIDESLRLYPPTPYNVRATVKEDKLPSGYIIPANTRVAISPFAQHRLAEYFNDPYTFNPDRWVTDPIKAFSYLPFYGGPRICLGQNMAYLEIKVAMCAIIPKFSFKLAENHPPIDFKVSITFPLRNGLHVVPIP